MAKQRGCRVIGIAGGAEKCRWLTEELGFDGAVDYKNEDVGDALDRLAPDGRRLVFYSDRGGNKEVYILDLASLKWTNISNHEASDEYCAWSP